MKTDIYQKLEIDFKSDFDEAVEQISILEVETKGNISDRLLRAIIYLASGSIHELKQAINLSQLDYRDVLWQAEYDCGEEILRDFNKTFNELKLL